MLAIKSIMPVTGRIQLPILIPKSSRYNMFLLPFGNPPPPLNLPPITILHPTPSPIVRNRVLSSSKIIPLSSTSGPGKRRIIFIQFFLFPSSPVRFQRHFAGCVLCGSYYSNVYIRSFVSEDVEKSPAFRPAWWVPRFRIFGPYPA